MKKTFLYSLAVLASVSLAAATATMTIGLILRPIHRKLSCPIWYHLYSGPEAECNMPDEDGVINLVTVNSTDANVSGYTLIDLKVNGERF